MLELGLVKLELDEELLLLERERRFAFFFRFCFFLRWRLLRLLLLVVQKGATNKQN